jgi:dTDP-4-dehydrorhamnose reductase
VDGSEADPALAEAINVEGTRNVIRAVRGTHTTVVYFSTDYVFDGVKGSPYVESDPTHPLSVYARTKLAGEQEVLSWVRGIVVRTAWLFSDTGTNFVKTILAAGARNAVPIWSSTYAGHLADAVGEALRQDVAPGLYHMAGSGYCSWCELAREVVQLAGIDVEVVPIATAELGRPAPRPAFSALASERPVPRLPNWAAGVAEAVDRLIPLG